MRPAFTPIFLAISAFLLAVGTGGGWVAAHLHVPLPWLMGSLAAAALAVAFGGRFLPDDYAFPQRFRVFFIGLIGVMIGTRIQPSLLGQVPWLAVSFTAIIVFVIAAQVGNYLIFRKIGGYDRATAWFSGSPGGLIEAVVMGEQAGADVRIMTIQQFLRIITVLTLLPLALSIYHGHPVGSAAGLNFTGGAESGWRDIAQMVVLVLVGGMLGRLARLPAWQLTGPLLASGLVTATGWSVTVPPAWTAPVAQVVMGTSLGTRFFGLTRALLVRAVGLSLLSVGLMLLVGGVLAELVHWITGLGFEMLFISLAPGGVTEMALVALSLNANPAFVTLHHLFRITLTVLFLGMARRLGVLPKAEK